MLDPAKFLDYMESLGVDFVTGVPDSLLMSFCQEVFARYGVNSKKHIVAVNEGNAVALAAGYHLATGKYPLVYLQNSGLGNAINPAISLTDPAVYGIPIIYLVGWRGEPGIADEPQHVKQGEITLSLLETLGIKYSIVEKETSLEAVKEVFNTACIPLLQQGKSVALVVRKGAFNQGSASFVDHKEELTREEAITSLVEVMQPEDYVISTTGKISRELYEYCKNHKPDCSAHNFLTVGSMGHASAIALSVALHHPEKCIWCLDGDGAVLMHMGSMATIGTMKPNNFIHIVLNNRAHESVGGMPTVAKDIDLATMAKAAGYCSAITIQTKEEFQAFLKKKRSALEKPALVQILVSTGSRKDLIRPETTPKQNKTVFMEALQK